MTSHIIQYVDYGSVASVMADQLRKLPTDYWKVPIQAIPCMLSLDEDDDYAVSDALRVIYKCLMINIVERSHA